ncbi:hypothetical protein N0V92_013306, partial [Colletotrichum tropicale]
RCRHRFLRRPRHRRPLLRRLLRGPRPGPVRLPRRRVPDDLPMGQQLRRRHPAVHKVHGRAERQHADLQLVPRAAQGLPGCRQPIL